ncbi:MAG: GGDEF domain-containing protein [Gammaproteobacteria bacterium]|nr:GGDEF domain-containing protein [Gammaproteobacteria bacterium]
MNNIIFAQLNYVVIMILITLIAACLLMFSPIPRNKPYRNTTVYFSAFFLCTAIGYSVFAARPYINSYVSIALTNLLFLLNVYCLKYGLQWRLGIQEHIFKCRYVLVHILIFIGSQFVIEYVVDEAQWVRTLNGTVNAAFVFWGCIKLVTPFSKGSNVGEKIAGFSFYTVILGYLVTPIFIASTLNTFYVSSIILTVQITTMVLLLGGLLSLLMSDVIDGHYQTSIRDPLTGIFNRRYFFQNVATLTNCPKTPEVNSVVICDIDKFKSINDKYGHDVGDDVLVAFAGMLTKSVGEFGVVSRYGGEEFTVLLKGYSLRDAINFTEQMRLNTEGLSMSIDGKLIQLTASFGISEIWDLNDIDLALKLADDALLRAKSDGRNKVLAS